MHNDPAEVWELDHRGGVRPYSPNPDHYMPLCRDCHRAWDDPTNRATTFTP